MLFCFDLDHLSVHVNTIRETQETNRSQMSVFILQTHYSIDIFLIVKKQFTSLKTKTKSSTEWLWVKYIIWINIFYFML